MNVTAGSLKKYILIRVSNFILLSGLNPILLKKNEWTPLYAFPFFY